MELVKKNVHMDYTKAVATTQFVLEDDVNLSDTKPDMDVICLEKGQVVIDEVKAYEDAVIVRGRLQFAVLYHSDEENRSLAVMEGKIPFEEKVQLPGVDGGDSVKAEGFIEDLSVSLINSRKISVQSVVNLKVNAEDIYDAQMPIGLHDAKGLEYRREPLEVAQIAISKYDVFRIREEVTLPGNYPNLFQILWSTLSLNDVEMRPHMGKISLQGDLQMLLIYESDEGEIRYLESTIPFSGNPECQGCSEEMIADIKYKIAQQDLHIRPDLDGEERVIALDVLLDLNMKMYEETKVEVISDVYGVKSAVETMEVPTVVRSLLAKNIGKQKLSQHIRIGKQNSNIMQLLHSEGSAGLDSVEVGNGTIQMMGTVSMHILYISGDERKMYDVLKALFPYKYEMEIPGVMPGDPVDARVSLEQLQVIILDGEEVEVKAVLVFHVTAFRQKEYLLVSEIKTEPLDSKVLAGLPGIVVYMVKPGDNLWSIGKRYHVSVDRLKKMNDLTGDLIVPGQKLIIVKEGI